jgi:hypothetical protein
MSDSKQIKQNTKMKSRKTIIILSALVTLTKLTVLAQTNDSTKFYKDAFAEQLQMIKGVKPISYKRAVFVAENAYFKGKLDYTTFCKGIRETGQQLKELIKKRGLEKYKTSGNWAIFTYMMDSIPLNNFRPFTYDFEDFMGNKDFSKMFVTKLMRTRSGNCHSLPSYYKILADEIGVKASLALAPNHMYIKHINEQGQWTNVELTNAGFPRDQWIIKEMAIPVEAIKSEVYMKPLTEKESIAITMLDLIEAYIFQHGYDDFVIASTNTAIKYFPKCIPLLMNKSNYYKFVGENEQKKQSPNLSLMKSYHNKYLEAQNAMDNLGYKDETPEHYKDWVKGVETEKKKREIANK